MRKWFIAVGTTGYIPIWLEDALHEASRKGKFNVSTKALSGLSRTKRKLKLHISTKVHFVLESTFETTSVAQKTSLPLLVY